MLYGTGERTTTQPPLQNEDETEEDVLGNDDTSSILDSLGSVVLDEEEGPVILRQLARAFLKEALEQEDPLAHYDYGIETVSFLLEEYDTPRMIGAIEYVLRVFEQHKRNYEAMVFRDISARNNNDESSLELDAAPDDDFSLDTSGEDGADEVVDEDLEALLAELESLESNP